MSAAVEINDLSFGYDDSAPIIEGLTMSFSPGHWHAIVGPSGCGKSTMMYLIGLMLRPTSGTIRMLGREYSRGTDSDRARDRERLIGFVFQDALLDTALTVEENISEGYPWSRPPADFRQHATELLAEMGVGTLATRLASHLSGGQAQRVALVRALAKRPPIVLADEPTGNLDDDSASIVLDHLHRYVHATDRCGIIVTHDASVAARCETITDLSGRREFNGSARYVPTDQ